MMGRRVGWEVGVNGGQGRRKGGSVGSAAGVARASADQYFISASPANPYFCARLLDSTIAPCVITSFSNLFVSLPSTRYQTSPRLATSALTFSFCVDVAAMAATPPAPCSFPVEIDRGSVGQRQDEYFTS